MKLRNLLHSAVLGIASLGLLGGATFSTINPPSGTEGDTISIVSSTFPDYVRLSDDDDQVFQDSGVFWFVFAFEDTIGGDYDYNDYILNVKIDNGVATVVNFVAGYAGASQLFSYNNSIAVDTSGRDTVYSQQSLNGGFDQMVTWQKSDVSDVPEPGTMVLMGLGLIGLAWRRR